MRLDSIFETKSVLPYRTEMSGVILVGIPFSHLRYTLYRMLVCSMQRTGTVKIQSYWSTPVLVPVTTCSLL